MGYYIMKKYIVITSIFEPTEAVIELAQRAEYKLIVVGDLKTPEDWHCSNVDYISVDQQKEIGEQLYDVLPFNHYSRKMFGYLSAIKNGAEIIVDTDDDNIPKANWEFPPFDGSFQNVPGDKGFVNIYQLFTDQPIWPRGLPLRLIRTKFNLDNDLTQQAVKVGIWQGLADEDPDVDAIYRLTSDEVCIFKNREPVVLGTGSYSPFNTQNTIIRKELFPLLYLPTFVTFRFTDILRGLVALPIMNIYNYQLGFTDATVVQKRNPHDYYKDFLSEIPMYQYTEEAIKIASEVSDPNRTITDNLYNVYDGLLAKNIVEKRELLVLEAWLQELKNINSC
jgi:hypothetical protein